jgi:hypothetical protein
MVEVNYEWYVSMFLRQETCIQGAFSMSKLVMFLTIKVEAF